MQPTPPRMKFKAELSRQRRAARFLYDFSVAGNRNKKRRVSERYSGSFLSESFFSHNFDFCRVIFLSPIRNITYFFSKYVKLTNLTFLLLETFRIVTERLRIFIYISNYFQILGKKWGKRSPIRMSLTERNHFMRVGEGRRGDARIHGKHIDGIFPKPPCFFLFRAPSWFGRNFGSEIHPMGCVFDYLVPGILQAVRVPRFDSFRTALPLWAPFTWN